MFRALTQRRPWRAALLAVIDPCIGLLYIGRWKIALVYLGVELITSILFIYSLPADLQSFAAQAVLGVIYLPVRLTGVVHAYVLCGRKETNVVDQ